MFAAVVHKVRRGLGNLYPLNACFYPQLLHRPPSMGDVIGTVSLRRHAGQSTLDGVNVQSSLSRVSFHWSQTVSVNRLGGDLFPLLCGSRRNVTTTLMCLQHRLWKTSSPCTTLLTSQLPSRPTFT